VDVFCAAVKEITDAAVVFCGRGEARFLEEGVKGLGDCLGRIGGLGWEIEASRECGYFLSFLLGVDAEDGR